MTVKCGVFKKGANKGKPWYMVDGKFATCADYMKAGGTCKAAKKDCGKKKVAKKRVAKKVAKK